MYDEDDLLPLSALQHLAFCERQCALIHLEGQWQENRLTAQGRQFHRKADETGTESRGDLRISRGLPLRSLRLGLVGKADVVEFHRVRKETSDPSAPAAKLPGVQGLWRPLPVEYKRGRPKPGSEDEVQLCAQALCLEEMFGADVPEGALFYGQPWKRFPVPLGPNLRDETEKLAERLHELMESKVTPPAVKMPRCRNCSLSEICLPRSTGLNSSASGYLEKLIDEALGQGGTDK
ncbi:CRISPR-associated protein Cas4 [bacterium]|nr:CRISPR-associated protein Cas4 [bacterium]